jgi:hypothetical protein
MKYRFSLFILLGLILVVAPKISFAQSSAISEIDFLVSHNVAYRATDAKYPRKRTYKYEVLSEGKVTYSSTEVTEYMGYDKYRIIETEISNGRTKVNEAIQIGQNRYCRENSAKWDNNCYEPPPAAAMGHIDGATYMLESAPDSKTYVRIYKTQKEEKGKPAPLVFVTEDRSFLNEDMSYRSRSIIRTNSVTKEIVSSTALKYEYGIKLSPIEAPIK